MRKLDVVQFTREKGMRVIEIVGGNDAGKIQDTVVFPNASFVGEIRTGDKVGFLAKIA